MSPLSPSFAAAFARNVRVRPPNGTPRAANDSARSGSGLGEEQRPRQERDLPNDRRGTGKGSPAT